jgi:cyclopropane fatty-acyl-phospholipid synthase-like methyltransferase
VSADPRKQTVEAGYDELAPRFGEWAARVEGDPWERFLDELAGRLALGARVLDLGCGNGRKIGRLAERFDVTGVDISEEQLRLARAEIPAASFAHADLAALDFPAESYDAVTAFYSISHVPREEHAALFGKVARWLSPGGLFLASLSANGTDDWTEEWLGVEMFFSSHDADTNLRLLEEAGLELVRSEIVTIQEPEGDATFLWALARKPS